LDKIQFGHNASAGFRKGGSGFFKARDTKMNARVVKGGGKGKDGAHRRKR